MKYNVGGHQHCPECGSRRAKIIWISEDEKTIAIKCPRSGYHHKKDAVMLMNP